MTTAIAIRTDILKTIRFLSLGALLALCLVATFNSAQAADEYGLNVTDGSTHSVEQGEEFSASATGGDKAYGGYFSNTSTLINAGTFSATGETGRAYGAYLDGASAINTGLLSGSNTHATGEYSYGARISNFSSMVNSGTISGSNINDRAYGLYLDESTASNSGSIYATSVNSRANAVFLRESSMTNSGTITATSDNTEAYGVCAEDSTVTNTGSITATSSNGESRAAYIIGSSSMRATLKNYGTIQASGATSSYAIYAKSYADIYLYDGTSISGEVYSNATTNTLHLDNSRDIDFALTGSWGATEKNGTGTWTLDSGTNATLTNLSVNAGTVAVSQNATVNITSDLTTSPGSTFNVVAHGQGVADVTVVGNATLNGTLAVDASASHLGTSSTVLSTGGVLSTSSVISTNPNFSITRTDTDAAGTVTVSTAFAPQDDASSLAVSATLASAQAFAGVAQVRSLTMLSVADEQPDEQSIMVASNGSLTGLLNPRQEDPQYRVYLQPVLSFGSRDGDTNEEGYDSQMLGLEAGIDRSFGNDLVLGIMAGIGTATIDFTGSDFVESDSDEQLLYTLGLYGGYRMGDWAFTDTLSATYADHDFQRNAGLGQTAKADYDSWLIANQFTAFYHWTPAERWEVTPRIGLNLTYLHRDSFNETGATNAVSYDDLDKVFAEANLGLRAQREFTFSDMLITPYLGAGLLQSLGNGDITVRQYLPTTSAEVTTDNDDSRLTGECGVTFGKGATAFTLGYTGEYGDTTRNHSVFGTLRVSF